MCATFTDDDVGKLVERTDGKVIGTVASLESEGAYVEPNPDVLDKLMARFDRGEIGDPFILDEDDVRNISDTRVHLAENFSRTPVQSAPSSDSAEANAGGDATDGASDSGATNRTNGGAAATASAGGDDGAIGPFDSRFNLGAGIVSGLLFLLAIVVGWTGYQTSELFLVGTELNVISGAAGLMLLSFFGVVTLVIALLMEPGFDH